MGVMNTVGKGGCVAAGAVLEGGAIGLQVVGSALVAVGTGVIRTGNKAADASEWCYEKAGVQHRPIRLLTSVDEIDKELKKAEERFTEFYNNLTKGSGEVPDTVDEMEETEETEETEDHGEPLSKKEIDLVPEILKAIAPDHIPVDEKKEEIPEAPSVLAPEHAL